MYGKYTSKFYLSLFGLLTFITIFGLNPRLAISQSKSLNFVAEKTAEGIKLTWQADTTINYSYKIYKFQIKRSDGKAKLNSNLESLKSFNNKIRYLALRQKHKNESKIITKLIRNLKKIRNLQVKQVLLKLNKKSLRENSIVKTLVDTKVISNAYYFYVLVANDPAGLATSIGMAFTKGVDVGVTTNSTNTPITASTLPVATSSPISQPTLSATVALPSPTSLVQFTKTAITIAPTPTKVSSTTAVPTVTISVLPTASPVSTTSPVSTPKTGIIKGLIITGGCCHDYGSQSQVIIDLSKKYGTFEWKVINQGGTGTSFTNPLYNDPNWAKGYDLVVHNECFADTSDPNYVKKITQAHKNGVPAVVIHCAMHTYRNTSVEDWREFLGVKSVSHDALIGYNVKNLNSQHTIAKGMPDSWRVNQDELYEILNVYSNTIPLAKATSSDGKREYPVAWAHMYGTTRVFGTTFGHTNETFQNPVYKEMLARGIAWAAGVIND